MESTTHPVRDLAPVLAEARRRLTSVESADLGINTAILPRHLLGILRRFCRDLGFIHAQLVTMLEANEINHAEYLNVLALEVDIHAYNTWEFAPEFDDLMPELDSMVQRVGIPSWTEAKRRQNGGKGVPEITSKQKKAFNKADEIWLKRYHQYEGRLFEELGEEGLGAFVRADGDMLSCLIESAALLDSDDLSDLVPEKCSIRKIRVYAIHPPKTDSARVFVIGKDEDVAQ